MMKYFFAFIFSIATLCVTAQTRFYFSSSEAAPVSVAWAPGWNVTPTGNTNKLKLLRNKDNSSILTLTSPAPGGASPRAIAIAQFVSDPLDAQTITEEFFATMRWAISSNAQSTIGYLEWVVRIVSKDGTVVKSTVINCVTAPACWLCDYATGGLASSLTSRCRNTGTSGNSIAIAKGDRLVIDLGWYYSSGTNTTRTASISVGNSSATDLPLSNSTTNANNPWVENQNTIVFESPDAPTNPTHDDVNDLFGWTNNPSYVNSSNYEYTTNGGGTWITVTSNPQYIGNIAAATGTVGVRVRLGATGNNSGLPGAPLWSTAAFTVTGSPRRAFVIGR